jgi:hypothetical protein
VKLLLIKKSIIIIIVFINSLLNEEENFESIKNIKNKTIINEYLCV